jgi:NADH-quinone oxidoreductase subunit G
MAFCDPSQSKHLVLHTPPSPVGAMDAGCVAEGGLAVALDGADVIYNLGADEIEIAAGPFVIYQGSHGDRGAHRADVILPGAAYTEEQGLFVNTEGRPQLALRASFAPGEAKENWAILRALSPQVGTTLPYDSLAQLRQKLVAEVPHLAALDTVPENPWQPLKVKAPARADFRTAIADFYLSNPIARASELMAELSARARARAETKIAAE